MLTCRFKRNDIVVPTSSERRLCIGVLFLAQRNVGQPGVVVGRTLLVERGGGSARRLGHDERNVGRKGWEDI